MVRLKVHVTDNFRLRAARIPLHIKAKLRCIIFWSLNFVSTLAWKMLYIAYVYSSWLNTRKVTAYNEIDVRFEPTVISGLVLTLGHTLIMFFTIFNGFHFNFR